MKRLSKNAILLFAANFCMATPLIAEGETNSEATAIDESVIAAPEKTEDEAPSTSVKVKPGVVAAKPSSTSSSAVLTPVPEGSEVSRGERFAIDVKGFSIVAPPGWIVQKNLARSSLYTQARVAEGDYPRNISVVRFQGPRLINEITAQEFSDRLVKTFPQTSSTIANYTLRNHQVIQMEDGREGILIYTDFLGSGRKMMQAHVLVSSETNHYLSTFTDVAEHFENPSDGAQFLAEAWSAMTSIQLDSATPSPGRGIEIAIGSILALGLLYFGVSTVRKFMASRSYKEFSNLDPGEGSSLIPNESPNGISQIPSNISQIASVVTQKIEPISDSAAHMEGDLSEDEGIRSAMGSRLVKLTRKISRKPKDVEADLEFVSEEIKQEFKRGA